MGIFAVRIGCNGNNLEGSSTSSWGWGWASGLDLELNCRTVSKSESLGQVYAALRLVRPKGFSACFTAFNGNNL